jgi:hypothetical protein
MENNRTGMVNFHDASLHVWEEGLGGSPKERDTWEKAFKHQVFKRIIQTLNRIGWECIIPEEMVKQYSRRFALNHRYCVKGDLKADLSISGRFIEFKMFQNVTAPERPDHEGRYQSDKEKCMPYVMWLEMERTRRRIRSYLCNVFPGYHFKADKLDGRMNKCGPGHLTAMEWLEGCYKTSWHFKGDIDTYQISDYNRESADGTRLEHGQRVWFTDRKGRILTGIAYYNINNMWWVIMGKYAHTNVASFHLHTVQPEDIRRKRNEELRKKRLAAEIGKAVNEMNYERAALLRDVLFGSREAAVMQNQAA